MDKNKKILLIGGIIEAAILIFALVVSILVWTTAHSAEQYPAYIREGWQEWQELNVTENGKMIGYFQNTPVAFFLIICLPIFIIVALDFVYFAVVASKRESNLSDAQLAELKKQAEAEVRAELEKEAKPEEKKQE